MFGKLVREVRNFGRSLPRAAFKAKNISKLSSSHTPEQSRLLEFVREYFSNVFGREKQAVQAAPIFLKKLHDNRPYISVNLFGKKIFALLDSGATHSIVGSTGIEFIKTLGLKLRNSVAKVITTADGVKHVVSGIVEAPIIINSNCRLVSLLVVPSLKHEFILGSDFIRKFQIKMDFRDNTWEVRDDDDTCISEIGAVDNNFTDNHLSILADLDLSQRAQMEDVLVEFKRLSRDGRLGLTNKITYHIDTGDAKPIKQRQYPFSPYILTHLNMELDKMLDLGVVEPSMSEWSSPVLLVRKSNGDFRFCFDGRKLNSITKKDSYPLPYVDSILNMLRDSRFISSVDLRSAFWQIPLDGESKEKTAFAIPGRGLYHFKVVPFGLSNAAQCQQRLMEAVFGPELEPNIFVYLDDIIIVSSTFEEHISLLREVVRRLHEANLTVNIEKCEFFRPSLKYLGFVVDKSGLRTDPDKISAMVNFPRPKNTTEVKRFVGMCGWYRRFIPHFSTLISPINDLIKGKNKGQKISWSDDAEKAFINVKQALISTPILTSPDFSLPFYIQCDASNTGLGCVLTQTQDGQEKVIAFASRSLSKSERNYSVTERECLSCVFGCQKFRPYVEGAKFYIVTDHASLKWLHNMRDPSGRLARWSVKLNQFDFEIIHRPGKFNVVPDALSRCAVDPAPNEDKVSVSAAEVDPDDCICLDIDLSNLDSFYKKLRSKIIQSPDDYPQWCVKSDYVYKLIPSKNPLNTNISEWKLLVPKGQRLKILKSCHDVPTAAHLGYFKTYCRVLSSYYWPKMRRDIYRYVKCCNICAAQKAPNYAKFGFMGAEKKCRFPWQVIALDLMGPLPRSGNGFEYLLVVSDWFTKYCLLCPLRKANAPSISRFLENEVFLVYGVPQHIICDNGRQLISKSIKKLVKDYDSHLWYTAYYHAQANYVERCNRTICTAIRCYIDNNHKSWDREIPKIGYALRTATHDVTGYSPAFLNFGRLVPASGNYYGKANDDGLLIEGRDEWAKNLGQLDVIFNDVQAKLHSAYKRNAKYYNLRRRNMEFHVGDKVWKRNIVLSNAARNFAQKLAPRYVLCVVHKKKSKLVYVLKNLDGSSAGEWHIQDLKPYHGNESDLPDSEVGSADEGANSDFSQESN